MTDEKRKMGTQYIEAELSIVSVKGGNESAEALFVPKKAGVEVRAQNEGLDESSWYSIIDRVEGLAFELKQEYCNGFSSRLSPLHFPRPRGKIEDIPLSEFFDDLYRTLEVLEIKLENEGITEQQKTIVRELRDKIAQCRVTCQATSST